MGKRAFTIRLVGFVGFSKNLKFTLAFQWNTNKNKKYNWDQIKNLKKKKKINHTDINTLPRDEQCYQQNRNTICTTATTMVLVQHYLCYFHERNPKRNSSAHLIFQKKCTETAIKNLEF